MGTIPRPDWVREDWISEDRWNSPAFQRRLAAERAQWEHATSRPCRYGLCVDDYDARGRIIASWGTCGPAPDYLDDCPHDRRGGTRGHGTWAEQVAPPCPVKPSTAGRKRTGWRRAR